MARRSRRFQVRAQSSVPTTACALRLFFITFCWFLPLLVLCFGFFLSPAAILEVSACFFIANCIYCCRYRKSQRVRDCRIRGLQRGLLIPRRSESAGAARCTLLAFRRCLQSAAQQARLSFVLHLLLVLESVFMLQEPTPRAAFHLPHSTVRYTHTHVLRVSYASFHCTSMPCLVRRYQAVLYDTPVAIKVLGKEKRTPLNVAQVLNIATCQHMHTHALYHELPVLQDSACFRGAAAALTSTWRPRGWPSERSLRRSNS
jgi:hypothetical protein